MSVRYLILNLALILIFFPVEMSALGSDGADVTLCKLNEEIYFSCPLSDGRIVSICAFENRNPSEGYVQYRYGAPDEIEMTYPQTKKSPAGIFYIVDASEGSVNKDILKFRSGRYTYIVSQAFVSFLTVLKDGEVIFRKSCSEGGNAFLSRSARLGIETIPKSAEDFR